MENSFEKRFSVYLKKVLKGYAIKQKKKYQRNIENNHELSDKEIVKLSYRKYLQNENEEWENIDVDENHLENIFHNEKYYKAMKRVPIKQRQILYFLIVKEYSTNEVAKIFKITSNNISKLKIKAIENFKRNLEENNEE